MKYRADVQGDGRGLREVSIEAVNYYDAMDSLEAMGFDVIELYRPSLMDLITEQVLSMSSN
jgi:hypothetical protein